MKEPIILWNSLPEGKVIQHDPSVWVVRTGVVVNKPQRQKKFEDGNVLLSWMEGDAHSVLGYSIQTKRKFHTTFAQDSYVSLLSDVDQHSNPIVLYKDHKVYLYRFNSKRVPSYWFLVRTRTTSLPSLPEIDSEN